MNSSTFTSRLLHWHQHHNSRHMPWKGEKNPYYIWLSEIILQQTRVEQGLPYFLKFKKAYPTVRHLANAHEDEVLKLWQGLGYYSRARNLHFTAKHIHKNLKGNFPDSLEDLKKLKGVGDYTAAAIASFAFGKPHAVVDGNVIRVLSRVFGVETPFNTTAGKKEFAALAQKLMDEKNPAAYNQAIMDFGGMVCAPQNPKCSECPMSSFCFAKKHHLISELPYREKKTKIISRYFTYLLVKNRNEIVIVKRTGNDIWKNLYELPLIETTKPLNKNFEKVIAQHLTNTEFKIAEVSEPMVQMLSHRKIHFRFITVSVKSLKAFDWQNAERAKLTSLSKFAFPKTIHLVLHEKGLV